MKRNALEWLKKEYLDWEDRLDYCCCPQDLIPEEFRVIGQPKCGDSCKNCWEKTTLDDGVEEIAEEVKPEEDEKLLTVIKNNDTTVSCYLTKEQVKLLNFLVKEEIIFNYMIVPKPKDL